MKVIYELTEETLDKVITDKLSILVEDKVINRYENVLIDSKAACQILGISESTLHRYMKAEVIETLPRIKTCKIQFKLSDVLRADKTKLKKIMRYGN